MKFPKSVHAEGWANHIDTTKPEHLPDALKDRGSAPRVMPTMSTAIPVSPVVTATVPPIVSPAIPLSAPAAAPRGSRSTTSRS